MTVGTGTNRGCSANPGSWRAIKNRPRDRAAMAPTPTVTNIRLVTPSFMPITVRPNKASIAPAIAPASPPAPAKTPMNAVPSNMIREPCTNLLIVLLFQRKSLLYVRLRIFVNVVFNVESSIKYTMSRESVDNVRKRSEARKRGGPASTGELEPWSCDERPPDLLCVGLEQFNRGEYFEQHETLEELWIAEPRLIRRLYQGILKIGVGFYKLRLGNYRGTVNHINGGIAYLRLFEDDCMGIEVARLIREAGEVRDRVIALGRERIGEFDLTCFPSVYYSRKTNRKDAKERKVR
jgi:uncharacterized protein